MLARGKDLSKTLVTIIGFRCQRSRYSPAPQGSTSDASWPAADRQERKRGFVLGHLAGLRRRQRREAGGAGHIHPRADRDGGHRGTICRGARTLCRRTRQRPAAGAAGLGTGIRQHGDGRMADRDREGQARSRLSGASRDQARASQGSRSGSARPDPTIGQADLPERWVSTDMLESIFAYRRKVFRIFSKQIPIPRSPRVWNFPRRRCTMGSSTATSCIALSDWV